MGERDDDAASAYFYMHDPGHAPWKRLAMAHSGAVVVASAAQFVWACWNSVADGEFDMGVALFVVTGLAGVTGMYGALDRKTLLSAVHLGSLGLALACVMGVYGFALGATNVCATVESGGECLSGRSLVDANVSLAAPAAAWVVGLVAGVVVAALATVSDAVPPAARISPFLNVGAGSRLPIAVFAYSVVGIGAGATSFVFAARSSYGDCGPLDAGCLAFPAVLVAATTGIYASLSKSPTYARIHIAALVLATAAVAAVFIYHLANKDNDSEAISRDAGLLALWIVGCTAATVVSSRHYGYVVERWLEAAGLRLLQ